jgi:hypothetical protein
MQNFRFTVFFLISLLGGSSLFAQEVSAAVPRQAYFSGQKLLEDLMIYEHGVSKNLTPVQMLTYGNALGYVNAIYDHGNYSRWNMLTLIKTDPKFSASFEGREDLKTAITKDFFCPPYGVSNGQFSAILVKYLKERPAIWSEDALHIIPKALKDAFPCSYKQLFPDQ